ncbi:trypsin-like peptidase domain-containing protein [Bradyrhizobium sp.]|uniref:trypsin-like peptidase domain-containing protein n=1 Tax=Bradyrhizobium sp. TaxID=376 RepID=UPI00403780EB
MSDKPNATRIRRGILAAGVLAAGIIGLAAAAWFAASPGSNWRDLYGWYSPAVGLRSAALPVGFEDLVERVKPAVVGVRAKVEQDDEEETLPGRGTSPNGRDRPQRRIATSQGSGFFISSDGLAMTTYHLVAHNKKIEVVTDGGKVHAAKLVGADPKTDLALLKVDGHEFPVVRMADRAPRIGEWVLAIGNPFGLGGTVTAGIVSAGAREIISPYNDFIQIDAPINRGNSGGPTFDVTGKVIGINSAIFSPSGGSVGVGFAIPAATVKSIADRLKETGGVSRGWIGVEVQSMSPDIAEGLGLDKPVAGVVVAEIAPDSPAMKAGIEPGDIISSFAGRPAGDERDLIRRVGDMPPGKTIELRLIRRNREKSVPVTLGELPVERAESTPDDESSEPSSGGDGSKMGLMLMPAEKMGVDVQGVVVAGLNPSGVAAQVGLSAGDVILEVGSNGVKTPDDFYKALAGVHAQGKRIALARIKSNEATRFVAIPVN